MGRVRPAFLREDHAPDSASLGVVSTPVLWAVRGESRLGECALPVSAAASEAALWGGVRSVGPVTHRTRLGRGRTLPWRVTRVSSS